MIPKNNVVQPATASYITSQYSLQFSYKLSTMTTNFTAVINKFASSCKKWVKKRSYFFTSAFIGSIIIVSLEFTSFCNQYINCRCEPLTCSITLLYKLHISTISNFLSLGKEWKALQHNVLQVHLFISFTLTPFYLLTKQCKNMYLASTWISCTTF